MPIYVPYLQLRARRLRSAITDAEQRLWFRIRRKQLLGVQFYRQRTIGPYIVDFFAPVVKLAIEVDGGQHLTDEGRAYDTKREAVLKRMGLRVLRFDNRQVLLETDAVTEEIWKAVRAAIG